MDKKQADRELARAKYKVGDSVFKPEGYQYYGEVRSVFLTKGGDIRYVVENYLSIGMLYIFRENQIRPTP